MKLHSGIFYSKDINVAEVFYKSLGFDVEYRSKDRFISFIFKDGGRLGIKKQKETREVPGHQTIFIEVTNIEELFERLSRMKIKVLKPLTKEEWATEFTILDPDDNKILFRSEEDKA